MHGAWMLVGLVVALTFGIGVCVDARKRNPELNLSAGVAFFVGAATAMVSFATLLVLLFGGFDK